MHWPGTLKKKNITDMSRKRIGSLQDDALITTGIIVGGYLLIKNILPSFGISDQDKEILDNQQTLDPTDDIFSSESTAYSGWFVDEGFDLEHDFSVSTSMDLYLRAYRQFLDGNLSPDNTLYPICLIYHNLHAAVIGHIFTGDQQAAMQALNSITNKWQVGAIAELWATEYGGFGTPSELYKNLRNGSWPMMYGINPSDLASQVTRLNNLPD